ncbi:uncharacterized protein [Haliotis asinina]|uniref:uncharacterized protein n=1 Tax=Haliotis asinina TaxID=109174 RepID=UPI003531944E
MGDSKARYEMSRALMNHLAPIKEESFLSSSSGASPRNVQQVRVNNRPILIQTLPPDPRKEPAHKPRPQPQPRKPANPTDTSVDQVVADYLHYAKYSAAIPVKTDTWDRNDTLYCSCCSDRNSENMRRKRGLPPEKPAHSSALKAEQRPAEANVREERSRPLRTTIPSNQSWMSYQPLPYAQTYLNPEFNRPAVVQEYLQSTQGDDERDKVRAQILESNTKFDQAMKKLRFTTQKLDPEFDETKFSFS